jgi:hypothetical protein
MRLAFLRPKYGVRWRMIASAALSLVPSPMGSEIRRARELSVAETVAI